MRTHVTFLSDEFNLTEEKPNFINPGCFGEDLAESLISLLSTNSDLKVDPAPGSEDWGWEILLCYKGRHFFIGLGPYDIKGYEGWLCFVESRLPFFKRWFGVCDESEHQHVCLALDCVLRSDLLVDDIRWHHKDDFVNGNEDRWSNTPD